MRRLKRIAPHPACDKSNSGAHLGNCVLDHLLVRHIALIAYKELVDALGGISINLLEPLLDVVEAVHIRNIVDDANAVGATVVGRGNGAETFLTSSVPLFLCVSSPSLAPNSNLLGGLRSGASQSCHPARSFGFSTLCQYHQRLKQLLGTYEVDADGGDVGLSIGVVGESQKEARLSDTGVTDEEELEEVVVPASSQ